MTNDWTSQSVLELAPDASSASAARGQARANKWPLMGRSQIALWGEVQGSGKKPYQVRIDLRGPAFKCSCPSRKFPCKHALGLLLILAEQADGIAEAEPPEWVCEWLESRDERAAKKQAKAETTVPKNADPQAQSIRAAKREANVSAGINQLSLLLADLVRQGLAWVQTQPYRYWENATARMIDAQAPGLARLVRELGDTVSSGEGWQSRFVRRIGRLQLAIEGYRRLISLPEATQADLRSLIGWTTSREDLLKLPAEEGIWCVAGVMVEEEDRLTVQRTWLIRASDGRPALVLDFIAPGQMLESVFVVGTAFPAQVIYYPGTMPLRAIIAYREDSAPPYEWPGIATIDEALNQYANALAANPWIEGWPVTLDNLTLLPNGNSPDTWLLRDREGVDLPLSPKRDAIWPLMSLSGGRPVKIFGQWDGDLFHLLGVWTGSAYYTMSQSPTRPTLARVA